MRLTARGETALKNAQPATGTTDERLLSAIPQRNRAVVLEINGQPQRSHCSVAHWACCLQLRLSSAANMSVYPTTYRSASRASSRGGSELSRGSRHTQTLADLRAMTA